MNFGLISTGKSTFSQRISGIKHEIGNGIKSKTKGAIISYCGKVSHIMKRFNIIEQIKVDPNLHVFNIDTEGFLHESNEYIMQYLLPLIKLCSVLMVHATSFTDYSIVPLLETFKHLTKNTILITIFNSGLIIDPSNDSIPYYLDLAKNSQIAENLISKKIDFEIIPCTDFRANNTNYISQKINNYLISKLLILISKKQWESASSFVHQLKEINSEYSSDFIQSIFSNKSVPDSILDVIVNHCYLQINQAFQEFKSNDVNTYDNLINDVSQKLNEMCKIANISNEKIEIQKNKIINYVKLQRINVDFKQFQEKMQKKIIIDTANKLEKERNLVEFLSEEISQIANLCFINLLMYIKNEDISKLKSLDTFFLLRCNEIIFTSARHIRSEIMNHIDEDIKEIAQNINQKCLSAIELIQNRIKAKQNKKFEIGARIFGIFASLFLYFKQQHVGNSLFHILGIENPFNLVEHPNEQNFVIRFRGQTFEASYDAIIAFCQNIKNQLGPSVMDLFDNIPHQIDPSIANLFQINFTKRDYSQYLEQLIINE